jgi:hypothetical protein
MRTLLAALTLSLVLAVGPPAQATKKSPEKKKDVATATQEAAKKKVATVTVSEVQNPGEIAAALTAEKLQAKSATEASASAATTSGTNEVFPGTQVRRAIGIFFGSTNTSSRHTAPLTGFS